MEFQVMEDSLNPLTVNFPAQPFRTVTSEPPEKPELVVIVYVSEDPPGLQ
jgi:hypothetical protein